MPKREHFDTLFWPNFSSCIQKASEINVKNFTNMYNKKVWKKIIKVISDKKCIHFHGNEAYKYASSYEISRFLKLQTRLPWQRQPFRKKLGSICILVLHIELPYQKSQKSMTCRANMSWNSLVLTENCC